MNACSTIVIVLLAFASHSFAQSSAQQVLTVEGEVQKSLILTVKDLAKYPATEVKAKDKDGKEHTYKGQS